MRTLQCCGVWRFGLILSLISRIVLISDQYWAIVLRLFDIELVSPHFIWQNKNHNLATCSSKSELKVAICVVLRWTSIPSRPRLIRLCLASPRVFSIFQCLYFYESVLSLFISYSYNNGTKQMHYHWSTSCDYILAISSNHSNSITR